MRTGAFDLVVSLPGAFDLVVSLPGAFFNPMFFLGEIVLSTALNLSGLFIYMRVYNPPWLVGLAAIAVLLLVGEVFYRRGAAAGANAAGWIAAVSLLVGLILLVIVAIRDWTLTPSMLCPRCGLRNLEDAWHFGLIMGAHLIIVGGLLSFILAIFMTGHAGGGAVAAAPVPVGEDAQVAVDEGAAAPVPIGEVAAAPAPVPIDEVAPDQPPGHRYPLRVRNERPR
jgi:hypothetical protein